MEVETASAMSSTVPRMFQAIGPMLLISIGYIDPGKWAAVVDGGARFGSDLLLLILFFNCAAVLCQYLSARISVVTGKNLAQICSEEYNSSTCLFLGVQAEISVIVFDLTMILGIAQGLNLLLGIDLCTCVLLTAIDVLLFPLFTSLLEKCKKEALFVGTAGVLLLCYVFGVLMSQPEVPLVMNGMLTRLSGGTAFTLMSLLGASIMPHNFYLHSSIVQQRQGSSPDISKSALCHDHLVAILCIFSGIFLVNYVVMNSAAIFFHRADLVVLTFQDALLLVDQVFRSPIAPFVFFLVLFVSSEIAALTWNLGGQVVLHNFFRLDIPVWLHRTTIRFFAIFPALYCSSSSGAEGIYQLLIFSQVILAMLLPSSVIPLFRVASSRSIMGALKMSHSVEFLALTTFMGMLGLKIMFVVEMLFGDSEWVGSLRWIIGDNRALPYAVLLATACASLAFMLVLAITPLKSESPPDEQVWNWEMQKTVPKLSAEGEANDISKLRCHEEEPEAQESLLEKSVESYSDCSVVEFDLDFPETVVDSDKEPHLPAVQEIHTAGHISPTYNPEKSTSIVELAKVESVDKEVSDIGLLDDVTLEKIDTTSENIDATSEKSDSVDLDLKTKKEVSALEVEKDYDEGDTAEPEDSSKRLPGNGPTSISEGPGSFRSLSGKFDDGGNGSGSLSRLCGLGRAARRQLAAILDEFWGQLYDFHGQTTQQAKARKLDILLGMDLKPTAKQNVSTAGMEPSGYFPLVGDRGSGLLINSSIYDSPKQQRMSGSIETSHGIQTGSSSLWSTPMLDAYVKSSSSSGLDPSEKRYSSLHLPPSSGGLDYQPATIHGYQIASYLSKINAQRNADSLNSYLDSPAPKTSFFPTSNYMDELSYALSPKPQNARFSSVHTPSMQNPMVSRINMLNAEQAPYNPPFSGQGANVGSPAYTKKYHSLPDVSALAVPHRDSYAAERNAQLSSPPGFGPSRKSYEQSLYSDVGSGDGVPVAFDELSPSNRYRGTSPLQLTSNSDAKSLWSRQPFEQLFGVAGNTHSMGDGIGIRSASVIPEAISYSVLEAKLLQSFRYCIMKLLKLEGSDWLFSLNGGTDEDLIDQVAARERFHYEPETKGVNRVVQMDESQYMSVERKFGSALTNEEAGLPPHCGEGCIWRVDLIVSFGVWCIRRILELSLMESRPELWGKYTYVLNRLQGVLDPAFTKPRSPPLPPCICLQLPAAHAKRSSALPHSGLLPPAAKPGKGKCTSASTVLDLIKDVEIAVSCRKGRTGTVAGDVAFPKGKENLASVLKRYKRRLSSKTTGTNGRGGGGGGGSSGTGFRKGYTPPTSYAL